MNGKEWCYVLCGLLVLFTCVSQSNHKDLFIAFKRQVKLLFYSFSIDFLFTILFGFFISVAHPLLNNTGFALNDVYCLDGYHTLVLGLAKL